MNNIIKESIKSIPQWQIDAFEALKAKKVITDYDYWNRLNNKITIGECMALLNRMEDVIEEKILNELIDTFKKC